MLIDCDSCTARPSACGGCIVTHLLQVGPVLGAAEDSWGDPSDADRLMDRMCDQGSADDGRGEPDRTAELTDAEVAAVAVLSAGGLVPPLRLVTPTRPPVRTTGTDGRAGRRGSRSRTG